MALGQTCDTLADVPAEVLADPMSAADRDRYASYFAANFPQLHATLSSPTNRS